MGILNTGMNMGDGFGDWDGDGGCVKCKMELRAAPACVLDAGCGVGVILIIVIGALGPLSFAFAICHSTKITRALLCGSNINKSSNSAV